MKESAIYYEDTLNKADYINELIYQAPDISNQENKDKNNRMLPYHKNITTKTGQPFLHLIDIRFPKKLTFNKIFNKNKVK